MKKLCIISEVIIIVSCLVMYAFVRPITYFGGMEPESAKMCIYMVTMYTDQSADGISFFADGVVNMDVVKYDLASSGIWRINSLRKIFDNGILFMGD